MSDDKVSIKDRLSRKNKELFISIGRETIDARYYISVCPKLLLSHRYRMSQVQPWTVGSSSAPYRTSDSNLKIANKYTCL